jgi:hypothetical protein
MGLTFLKSATVLKILGGEVPVYRSRAELMSNVHAAKRPDGIRTVLNLYGVTFGSLDEWFVVHHYGDEA